MKRLLLLEMKKVKSEVMTPWLKQRRKTQKEVMRQRTKKTWKRSDLHNLLNLPNLKTSGFLLLLLSIFFIVLLSWLLLLLLS
ncbi:hypothetical protein Bca101_059607 [Brassica carinata]